MKNTILGALGAMTLILASIPSIHAQKLISEPIQGHTTPTSIRIWLMAKDANKVTIQLGDQSLEFSTEGKPNWRGNIPVEIAFENLKPATAYPISISLDGNKVDASWSVRTSDAFDAKDFSFTIGSCYLYGTGAMRMVRPGSFTHIFEAMMARPADFNIWLGDNVYLLLGEWNSVRRCYEKYTKVRLDERTNRFLRSRPQYAITDDHDFGPDNSGNEFEGKDMTTRCFNDFWPNPTRNDDAMGNYSKFSHQDCDFFLLDGRYFRQAEGRKQMYGQEQMNWLKEGLKASKATFKFIATGSQTLSEVNQGETWADYDEKKAFLKFIAEEKIEGVVFMSGDRHFTEMMRLESPGCYPIHEVTCSPLTSILRTKPLDPKDPEHVNPIRVEGTLLVDHNYGRISISGPKENRQCLIEILGDEGNLIWSQKIHSQDLKF